MDKFTDEDLKRLKECLKKHGHVDIGACNGEAVDFKVLLARLEAAEKIVNALTGFPIPEINERVRIVEAWRKVAGKK